MNKVFWLGLFLCLLGILTACTHVSDDLLLAKRHAPAELTVLLANDISALSTAIDPLEAFELADAAIKTTYRLAQKYDMSGPPEYHNVMVNLGFRERGLCWHWATDLLNTFLALDLKTINFMWAVANAGSDLNEHNVAVILPANDLQLSSGLIFDPWRTSGQPYWILLKDDLKYEWVELPREKW